MLRLTVLFVGVVLMITGCNGLLSTGFGTHKLRTLTAEQAVRNGVGDADYVALSGGYLRQDDAIQFERNGHTYRVVPFVPSDQSEETARLAVWYEGEGIEPTQGGSVRGTVEPLSLDGSVTLNAWTAATFVDGGPQLMIHLNERPTAAWVLWLMLIGGLLLAVVPEAVQHRSRPDSTQGAT